MPMLQAMQDTIRVGSEMIGEGRFSSEFEIEEMEGEFHRNVTVIEEERITRIVNGVERMSVIRKMKTVKEPFSKGYMLYYPQAHSVFVAADDIDQLKQLGVPLDENDEVITSPNRQLPGLALTAKEAVMKSEGRKRRSTVGGIEEAMKG